MKLVELIKHLKRIDKAEQFISKELPNVEFDSVDIFMVNDLNLNADIKFFDAESVSHGSEIEIAGVQLINFLPLYMAQEMVEAYMNLEGQMTDLEIAKALLSYSINDA